VASTAILQSGSLNCLLHAAENYDELRWYALYTSANHEKGVAEQLARRSIEKFLPLYESVRRWKDRRKLLQLPLFPGYVFVRVALRNRLPILQIPGVVRLVGSNGTPTPLFDEEVESLRRALESEVRAEPHPYLSKGRKVQISTGPLAGRNAIVIRHKGKRRVVISTELIQRSIMLDIDVLDVVPIRSRSTIADPQGLKWKGGEFYTSTISRSREWIK
jgi:transcription antitermination factor NusG